MKELQNFLQRQIDQRFGSMRKLASALDVDPSTLSRILTEANPNVPKVEFLIRLSAVTKVDLITIMQMTYPEDMAIAVTEVSPSAKALAQEIEALPEQKREIVERMVRAVVD